jgi:hypothetical protein
MTQDEKTELAKQLLEVWPRPEVAWLLRVSKATITRWTNPIVAEYHHKYNQNPDVREKRREFNRQPEVRERKREQAQRPETREQNNKRHRERLATDPNYKLSIYLRSRLYSAIRGNYKAGSAVRDLGCSIAELKLHLEAQFTEGMSWGNHGEWHIDHVRPLASFDLTDREQFLAAVNWSNLQPLWAKDNLSKGAKVA